MSALSQERTHAPQKCGSPALTSFGLGASVTPEVSMAAAEVTDRVANEVSTLGAQAMFPFALAATFSDAATLGSVQWMQASAALTASALA